MYSWTVTYLPILRTDIEIIIKHMRCWIAFTKFRSLTIYVQDIVYVAS